MAARIRALAIGAMALGCVAAAPAAAGSSGKVVGLLSGAAMLTVVWLAFSDYLAPLLVDHDSGLVTAIEILCVITIVKFAMHPFFPGFGADVGSYESWADQIATFGPAHTYQEGYFLDYPPGYLYGLWVVGLIVKLVGAGGDLQRVIVESPALVADLAVGLMIFAIVRRRGANATIATVAMLMVALNPAVIHDSVVWGQSDSVLTFTILLSIVAILASQYELCWGIAAISVLIKPQGLMVVPVLGLWTLLEGDYRVWIRSAVSFISVAIIGLAPFQIGHPWNWILNLYTSTAAYYHETSVNAFNLLALLGGLRASDSDTIAGVSYFSLGMTLLVPLYAYITWILARGRSQQRLMFTVFIAIFGFFMLAPRMHERYLYPALVLSAPLALESSTMMAVFAIISATCFFNLAYVLHTLQTVVFLDGRDGLAMAASACNLVAFTLAVYFGVIGLECDGEKAAEPLRRFVPAVASVRTTPSAPAALPTEEEIGPFPWRMVDTAIVTLLLLVAAITRFWHLGSPAEIVFDEVHFVGQARHYLHGEYFLDPHPPLAKLVIAAGIWLFGDHPWSWRAGNALIGTALVAITYLLGRRLTGSRIAAALSAAFILCDGLYLVDSRIAVIDIVYLTLAAVSYLLLFKFVQTKGIRDRRRVLLWLGVTLGLCVGSKLYIPAVTFLLVGGFLIYVLATKPSLSEPPVPATQRLLDRRVLGASILVGSVAAAAYVAVFIPHFVLGWWGGIQDLFHYYGEVVWYERSVADATHPYASPWWSWPLMLRPVAYWQDFPKNGPVKTVWGGGNPMLWWGGLSAIVITSIQALERPNLSRCFLVVGYLAYIVCWIWIGRTLFLYHYMGSIYLAYLALGWVLAQSWNGQLEIIDQIVVLATTIPVCLLGLGATWGVAVLILLGAGYAVVLTRTPYAGRYVAGVFVIAAAIVFIYFFPLWVGTLMPRSGYYARMWLQGSGLRSWI